MHQAIKHQVRHRPHVPAILKLPEILRKMLPADMNVGAVDRALQVRPEALDCIDASAVALAGIFLFAVVHGQVPETMLVDALIGVGFVGAESAHAAKPKRTKRARAVAAVFFLLNVMLVIFSSDKARRQLC